MCTHPSPSLLWYCANTLYEPQAGRIGVLDLRNKHRAQHVHPSLTLSGLACTEIRVGRGVKLRLLGIFLGWWTEQTGSILHMTQC